MASTQQHRCVFVGNIPYDATEEQLIQICEEVGPVVSFRLVVDRETGKPKGYGFCEYKDEETALSARRNIQGYEINGRQLRVDFAENDKGADRNRDQAHIILGMVTPQMLQMPNIRKASTTNLDSVTQGGQVGQPQTTTSFTGLTPSCTCVFFSSSEPNSPFCTSSRAFYPSCTCGYPDGGCTTIESFYTTFRSDTCWTADRLSNFFSAKHHKLLSYNIQYPWDLSFLDVALSYPSLK